MTTSPFQQPDQRKNIFIENDEEISSIISRIRSADGSEIALVVPRGSAILQSLVNLKLLKKQAESLKKEMRLVTTDNVGRNLASQAGLEVYETIHSEKPTLEPRQSLPQTNQVIKIDKSTPESPQVPVHHFQDPNGQNSDNQKPVMDKTESSPAQSDKTEDSTADSEPTPDLPLTVRETEPERKAPEITRLGRFPGMRISLKPRFKFRKTPLTLVLVSIATGLMLSYFFIPRAVIVFTVQGEDFEDSFRLEVNTAIKTTSLEERKIPGHLVETEKQTEKTFPASGAKNVGEKAQGQVVFYNSWSTENQTLPAGATLSKDNKQFLTTADITVPGATLSLSEGKIVTNAGTAPGLVQATEAGEEYNLSSGKFTIAGFSADKQEKFYAQSSQSFSGGSTQEVKVVSAEDLEKASQELRSSLSQEIFIELEGKNKDRTVLEDAIEYILASQQATVQENQEAKDFNLTLRLKGQAISFEKETFQKSFVELIKMELPEGKDLHLDSGDQITTSVKEKEIEEGRLIVEGSIKTQIAPRLDQAKLKKMVYGKKAGQAKDLLESQPHIEKVKIDVSPQWLPYRIPYFSFAVKSKIEYQ